MSVTSVQSVKSLDHLTSYLAGDAGERLAKQSGLTNEQMLTLAKNVQGICRRTVKAYSYVQSFSQNEFKISETRDIESVNAAGVKLAEKMHPHALYTVITHVDGAGQALHNHIVCLNHSADTGKALTKYRRAKDVQRANDELMQELGYDVCTAAKRPTTWEQKRVKLSPDSVSRRCGDLVEAARQEARSMTEFQKILEDQGFKVVFWGKKGVQGITYHMPVQGERRSHRRAQANRLCDDFMPDNLERYFAQKHLETVAMDNADKMQKDIARSTPKIASSEPRTALARANNAQPPEDKPLSIQSQKTPSVVSIEKGAVRVSENAVSAAILILEKPKLDPKRITLQANAELNKPKGDLAAKFNEAIKTTAPKHPTLAAILSLLHEWWKRGVDYLRSSKRERRGMADRAWTRARKATGATSRRAPRSSDQRRRSTFATRPPSRSSAQGRSRSL